MGDQEIFRTVFGAGGTNRSFDPYASGGSYDSRGSDSEDEAAAGAGAAAKVPALLVSAPGRRAAAYLGSFEMMYCGACFLEAPMASLLYPRGFQKLYGAPPLSLRRW